MLPMIEMGPFSLINTKQQPLEPAGGIETKAKEYVWMGWGGRRRGAEGGWVMGNATGHELNKYKNMERRHRVQRLLTWHATSRDLK